MQILVVDDARDSADSLAALATEIGHTVVVAYDCKTAMQYATTRSFDVILCDVGLPDGDGRQTCERLRSAGASQDACMIAITGRTDLRGDDFPSFDGYLHKPITWPALRHALETWGKAGLDLDFQKPAAPVNDGP
ncbi:response regulator [Caballeronia glathei]|uniref:Two-component response regulator protein n=2 Tax=Caballeronia glathei TaxID=60547 RepID=A0A069PEQ1_9BURK|nr:two-component response regulator protein [Caballeronia glathei]